jgi:hypothetical protein
MLVAAMFEVHDVHPAGSKLAKNHLERRDPLVPQTYPWPPSPPHSHGLVRQVEEEDAARTKLPDPELQSLLPPLEMFQAVGAEYEIQRAVRECIELVCILVDFVPDRYRAG